MRSQWDVHDINVGLRRLTIKQNHRRLHHADCEGVDDLAYIEPFKYRRDLPRFELPDVLAHSVVGLKVGSDCDDGHERLRDDGHVVICAIPDASKGRRAGGKASNDDKRGESPQCPVRP